MAKSDLLITLVKAGLTGDRLGARNVAEAIIADERAKQHKVLGDKLYRALRANVVEASGGPRRGRPHPPDKAEAAGAVHVVAESHRPNRPEIVGLSEIGRMSH